MSMHTHASTKAKAQRSAIVLKAMLVIFLAATVAVSTFRMTRTEADNTEMPVETFAARTNIRANLLSAGFADQVKTLSAFSGSAKAAGEKTTEAQTQTVYFEDAPKNVALQNAGRRTETTTAAKPATTAPTTTPTTIAQTTTEATTRLPGFSFYELGLSQWSDIEIPDDIRFGEDGLPLNYSYTIRGGATAYYGGVMTSTGASVHPGIVAVDPDIIPYHTRMYIVTDSGTIYGYCVAEDTGGFIYLDDGPTFDVYMWSYDDCCTWGYQNVTAYIFD